MNALRIRRSKASSAHTMALATFRASGSGKLEASSSGLQSAPAETLLNTFDQTVQRPTLGASDSLYWGANYEPVANDELVLTQLVVTLTEPPAPDADFFPLSPNA